VRTDGAARVLNDLSEPDEESRAWARHLEGAGFQAAALLPVHIEGLVDGAMAVLSHRPGIFDQDELELLERTASTLGYGLAARRAQRARDRAERDCRYLTHFDRLTGLPNRNRLLERMRELVDGDTATPTAAVLVINLDRFKLVNNTTGHEAGDQLLLQAVRRLQTIVRENDMLARQAADEFIVLVDGDDPRETGDGHESQAVRTAQRVIETMRRPIQVAGYDYYVGASVGISHVDADTTDLQATLRQAGTAMRQAKEGGGNTWSIYSGELTEWHTRRLSLEGQLHRAIDRGEFVLHYQPIVDLESGELKGVEALVRWPQADGSLLGPDAFIPVAEETGLMEGLGHWVFDTACRQLRAWQDAGLDPYVSVNLSVHQLLRPRLAQDFSEVIAATGATARRIELEVTESAMMTDPGRTERIVRSLHERGLGIALDDFGMGYSSLSRLKHLPITTLKIDKDFVLGLPSDPAERTIVRSIVQLAENLRVRAVAEGIETAEHRRALRAIGCRFGQGFHFSEPVPAEMLQRHLDPAGSDDAGAGHGARRQQSP
jgi:diguanylate cyclase (GGDEF)-like protein